MLSFALPAGPLRLLCLGAHADDIEIGCGGTLLHLSVRHQLDVHWVVFSAEGPRKAEAQASARRFLSEARDARVVVHSFRDGYFPFIGAEIKDTFEAIKGTTRPDVVFTHYRDDRHQDHRLISDLTWNTFREHLILEYEVPKYDGDLGQPNLFVPLVSSICHSKVRHLLDSFATQRSKPWFTEETFLGLMRLRGVEAGAPDGYAEAFYGRKVQTFGGAS